jgi:hypothetical protein
MSTRSLILPPHPLAERERMEKESIEVNARSIRETGADILWWKLIRNPQFRAMVEAADDRIRKLAADDLARLRAAELGVWQGIEAEYERRRRAPGLQLAAQTPKGLDLLLKKLGEERSGGTTYGLEAEYAHVKRQIKKAQERGDRIVILGKRSGAELKRLFLTIDPSIDVSILEDHKQYGGDLMIIGLDRRDLENWVKHLALWGQNDQAGLITKTVQMKWGETPNAEDTLYQITYAGIQLSGSRDESALPFGHQEISVGVLNPGHPWNALNGSNAASALVPLLHESMISGTHVVPGRSSISVPKCGLYSFVTRIVIRTSSWTFRFTVDAKSKMINLVSAQSAPNQHAALLAIPRPGKLTAGSRFGTLIFMPKTGAAIGGGTWAIQVDSSFKGQRRFELATQPGTLPGGTKVTFDVTLTGVVSNVQRKS